MLVVILCKLHLEWRMSIGTDLKRQFNWWLFKVPKLHIFSSSNTYFSKLKIRSISQILDPFKCLRLSIILIHQHWIFKRSLSPTLGFWIGKYKVLGHIKSCSHPKLNISSLLHLTWIKLSLKNAHWKCWVWNWTPETYLRCWGSKGRHCEDLYLIWNNEKT